MVAEVGDPSLLKERGNDAFKKGEYDAAIHMYSEALEVLGDKRRPESAVVLKNRAACLLKLERYEEVVDDINTCISYGGGDSKAYYRRAVAQQNLKALDKALKDSMEAVRIDPKNKSAIELVLAVRKDIQNRKSLMTSTTGLVDEMLTSLRDEAAPVDKKTQAMKNLVNLTSSNAGCEKVMSKGGLKDILRYLHHEQLQIHTLNCVMCLLRDSLKRTKLVLESVPLEDSLRILKQKDEGSVLIGGLLFEMLSSTLEDRGYDYTKRVLGQPVKKFPVPKLLPTLFKYFEECCKIADGESLNSLMNAIVRCTDSRVLNEQLLEKEEIKFMLSMVVEGRLSYSHAQQLAVVISKIWSRARIDDKVTLKFIRQCSVLINPRLLSGEETHQMWAIRALNVVLQGSFEAGGDIIKDSAELYRVVSKLLCSKSPETQRTAAECVALMASDKKMCYNLADQNFNLLKALYKSPEVDDTVKLRALVGMSKMCASSGGDVNKNVIAEGAGARLHKQARVFLLSNPTEEVRMWVIEALAYLTIDAEVKHDLVMDKEQMRIICDFSGDPTPSTCYSLSCIFMNLTNSYDKPDISPEMVRLAQYAKQNIPEAHELDSEDNLRKRITEMMVYKVPSVLTACSNADSERTREFLARSFLGIVSSADGEHCGSVVQMGGTRALLNLFDTNSKEGKVFAAHAIAKIAIKMNPALAFSGQKALDACRPCISLIESTNQNTFLVYDGLLALTNLASVSDSVRERIVREEGCHHIEYQQLEDNEALRRAATQAVCNLALSQKVRERYCPDEETGAPKDRLKAIFVFCGDEDYHTRLAALGAVAYLTADKRICKSLTEIGSFIEVIKDTVCIDDQGIRHRMLVILQNMIASQKEVADYVIGTEIFECLLALQQMPDIGKAMKDLIVGCMDAAKHWGIIQKNPGDMAYMAAAAEQ